MADPNVKAMRAFIAVMTHGTVSEAARRMNITQPALSRTLSGFEDELGMALFRRVRRRLVPTPEARALVRDVERALIVLDEIPTLARDIKADHAGTVRIAALPRLAHGLVGPAIRALRARRPGPRYIVDIRERREVERWVASRINDLGLVTLPVEHPAIALEAFARVRLCAILPAGHPLSRRSDIGVDELSGEPLILPAEGTMMRQRLEQVFAEANVRPYAAIECPSTVLACQFVGDGLGYTISDAISTALNPAAVRAVPLRPRVDFQLGFVGPLGRSASPTTAELRQEIALVAQRYGAEPIAGADGDGQLNHAFGASK